MAVSVHPRRILALLLAGGFGGGIACTTPIEIGNSVPTGGESSSVGTDSEGSSSDDGELPEGEEACEAFDLLFVMDDSEGMSAQHQKVMDVFPDFVRDLRESTRVIPVNLMVVDTSGGVPAPELPVHECSGAGCCTAMCEEGMIKPYPYCAEDGGDMRTCTEWRMDIEFNACDRTLGAGKIRNDAEYVDCQGGPNRRYANSYGSPFGKAMRCLGNVGEGGNSDERIMGAMKRAVEMAYPGNCNEGFIRDDAVLVVTFVTNAAEGESEWDLQSWRDALTIAKQEREGRIVVLGIFGDGDLDDPICNTEAGEAEIAPRLREMVDSYGDLGVACSVCADDYTDCFEEAAAVVAAACQGPAVP